MLLIKKCILIQHLVDVGAILQISLHLRYLLKLEIQEIVDGCAGYPLTS